MKFYEANFDGLVGPTHNYAGLSIGNVASLSSAKALSNPKDAALQGLAKMKALNDLGLKQGVLAPQERPDVNALRRIGFTGSDQEVISKAFTQAPAIFLACCSASSMWTANAATVSPSADCIDRRVNFTPANLTNKFHRSLEPDTTGRILRAVFADQTHFAHHKHLPDNEHFGDEGAANHTRLCSRYGQAGVELFVYGRHAFDSGQPAPSKYPARQTLEASQAIARLHGLTDDGVVYIQQNPDVIDQGVFHNDVIAVGNRNVLLFHEQAFQDKNHVLNEIAQKFGDPSTLHLIEVLNSEVSISDAIKSYLFNTQIVSLNDTSMAIIAPYECKQNENVANYLEELIQRENPITEVKYIDVKQSMKNGGGPACLRLRVVLSESELAATNQNCLLNETLYVKLTDWVKQHYRDQLSFDDMRDPELLTESRTALDELTRILNLGNVYRFQLS